MYIVTVRFGLDGEVTQVRKFETMAEHNAYVLGVEDATGWLESSFEYIEYCPKCGSGCPIELTVEPCSSCGYKLKGD